MKFNLNKKQRSKKIPVLQLGIRKKATTALWVLLAFSLLFAIFKNFTAIDKHTIHEKEIIDKQIIDTNSIESFVERFAKVYYSWEQDQPSLDKRTEQLKKYLTTDLQNLNIDMIRADIPTSSSVKLTQIWNISQTDVNNYNVVFSVDQNITENEKTKTITSSYITTIYRDSKGNLVIIQNPTIYSIPTKSPFEPKNIESDGTVDADTTKEIDDFLKSFFTLYPTASEKELAYYVNNNTLRPINKEYIFVEIINPVYTKKNGKITVHLKIKYLDNRTKSEQISEFTLKLIKKTNWIITD